MFLYEGTNDPVFKFPAILGQTAKKDDVTKAFGTNKMPDIIKEILEKGDLQVLGAFMNH